MKKIGLIWWITVLSVWGLYAQTDSVEVWRARGYEAKTRGELREAVRWYARILEARPGDYDARLALARLYVQTGRYEEAERLFEQMLEEDPSDAEALKGLGDVYLYTDRYDSAIAYYRRAVEAAPDHIPFYFDLARAYAWAGRLDDAVAVYRTILQKDDTYAEAWQGLGKMYWWKNKPVTALRYYRRALRWDPASEEIRKEYEELLKETAVVWDNKLKPVYEGEENYEILALSHVSTLSQRVTDNWSVAAMHHLDYSRRDFYNPDMSDTLRWYHSAGLKSSVYLTDHRFDIYGSYSATDEKFSSYGLGWQWDFSAGRFRFRQSVDAGYEYFYYWNRVGHHRLEERFRADYKAWRAELELQGGVVDKAFILDVPADRYEEDYNPFFGGGVTLSYRLLRKPELRVGAGYSYLTYTYKSNRYYSPLGRRLLGPEVSVYAPLGSFYVYAYTGTRWGSEYYWERIKAGGPGPGPGGNKEVLRKVYVPVYSLSADVEAGYSRKAWEAYLTWGAFVTPFYRNMHTSVGVKYYFFRK
ncbi:MAG: tetratricopeptide repeat protein [Chlorobi bacterium]|nr:tetratricopeptide repeat protein [Chlorobiota bacterium]